jgi:glucosyl-dolichyl phosphate glucuronosyltransferase
MQPGSILVSIVICTYNRPEDLARVLESLAPQVAARPDCELLVVENAVDADTRELAEHARAKYVREDRPGLSHARNRGWREARGAYVAYIDDDAVAHPDWLANMCAALAAEEPPMLGGPHYPFFLVAPPAWFPKESVTWTLGEEPRAMEVHEHLIGCNFVVRRAVLDELGGFRTDLGMIADAQGYGEDTEIQDRLRGRIPGARILYRPDVAIDHVVRAEKMTFGWWWRRTLRQGVQAGGIYDEREFGTGRLRLLRCAFYAVGHAAWAAGHVALCPVRSRRQWPFWRTHFLQRVFPHVRSSLAYCSFLWTRTFGRRQTA